MRRSDFLGIQEETSDGAVSYGFNAAHKGALLHLPENQQRPQIGETVVFNPFLFPYDFSVQAYFHNGE